MTSRRRLLVSLLLGLVGALGCRRGLPSSPHVVTYRLEWDWHGASPPDGERGWHVTNDRGYEVRVDAGYVTSRSMELIECPRDAATPLALSWDVLGPATALAGHSIGTPNPAAILVARIERLVPPAAVENGTVMLAPQRYCGTHYLVARAPKEALELPSEIDMVDKSLYVSGTYVAPGASEPRPFTVATSVAYGVARDLAAPGTPTATPYTTRLDTGVEGATVVVRRALGTMFAGVDFEAMRADVVARMVVTNLLEQTVIEVRRSGSAA